MGIDIDIRQHNREAIEAHPMFKRISMIEGSSIAPEIIEQVKAKAQGKQKILVCLDSNHSHVHVLAELQAYAPMTSVGSYCVVFDTIIEDFENENAGKTDHEMHMMLSRLIELFTEIDNMFAG